MKLELSRVEKGRGIKNRKNNNPYLIVIDEIGEILEKIGNRG
jgi:hypothetical protein